MANNIIRRKWNQNTMVSIEDLSGSVFQAESGGHTFEISGVDNYGNTVALSGTVAGVFMRSDNTDVAITGTASGGIVTVTLPAECYDVPGRFGLTVFVTADSKKTAVYAAIGTVRRTSSGSVAPGTTADVVDLINQINAAVATIPQSWSGLMADIAPTYSTSAVYPVGAYVYYDGDLYRCTTAITTAESWTAAHWTAAVLGNDVSDLKSELDNTKSETNEVCIIPEFRNGSTSSTSQSQSIAFESIYPIPEAREFDVIVPLNFQKTNNHFRLVMETYDITSGKPENNTGHRVTQNAEYFMLSNSHIYHIKITDNSVGFAIGLTEQESDYSTYDALRIESTGIHPMICLTTKNNKFQPQYPELRRGTLGSKGNTNAISYLRVEDKKGALGAKFYISSPPASGNHYSIQLTTANINTGNTPIEVSDRITNEVEYNFDTNSSVIYIPFDQVSIGYAITLFENDSSGNRVSVINKGLRILVSIEYPESNLPDTMAYIPDLRNGTTGNAGNSKGICFSSIKAKNGCVGATFFVDHPPASGDHYRLVLTTTNIASGNIPINQANRVINEQVFDFPVNTTIMYLPFDPVSVGYAVSLLEVNSSNEFVALRVGSAKLSVIENYIQLYYNNYVINSDCLKKTFKTEKISESYSSIKYLQAFCVYDGKYYSTDGSHIAEQDNSFTVLRDVELSLGHGNSMQLGTSHYAYVSDWHNDTDNDCKIYKVDLTNLTIDETYSIPLSGYTTGVVDDLNDIAYILHRDTEPSTVANYNFVTVDLTDSSIISTRKIMPFLALQAMDYYKGKIFFAYGLGRDSIINGIIMLNTVGDVLNEYVIDVLATSEVEGVFINRDNSGILFSVYNKSIYKISN